MPRHRTLALFLGLAAFASCDVEEVTSEGQFKKILSDNIAVVVDDRGLRIRPEAPPRVEAKSKPFPERRPPWHEPPASEGPLARKAPPPPVPPWREGQPKRAAEAEPKAVAKAKTAAVPAKMCLRSGRARRPGRRCCASYAGMTAGRSACTRPVGRCGSASAPRPPSPPGAWERVAGGCAGARQIRRGGSARPAEKNPKIQQD